MVSNTMVIAAVMACLSVTSAYQMGVLAYPAQEKRISPTCFTRGSDDPFTCGWYCAHAFYIETFDDGSVMWTPFGDGNNADNAYCSDCSLFEGEGYSPDLTSMEGALAEGTLNGGYKWAAWYDADAEEVNVNFTDYEEPCEIRYIVTEGTVMGVDAASDRPATQNTEATLIMTGWGGPKVVCEQSLANCINWNVYVEGDVADWQSLDEEVTDDVCPSRVTVYSLQNEDYCGHDGTPRGVDSGLEEGEIWSDRNTIISWSNPFNMTKCQLFFAVTEGCWNGQGPACTGAAAKEHQAKLPSLEERIRQVKAQRLAKKQQGHARSQQLPMARPQHISPAAWNKAMPNGDFATTDKPSWWPSGEMSLFGFAGWALACLLVAAFVVKSKCGDADAAEKASPARRETYTMLHE